MRITYQKNLDKVAKKITENVNCEIFPVREVTDRENRLFLEVMIKTSFKNYFIYLSKEYVYLNNSDLLECSLGNWNDKYYVTKNDLNQLNNFDNLTHISNEEVLYPVLNESNITVHDTTKLMMNKYLKILEDNSIDHINSQITKKSKNGNGFIYTIYLNSNLTLNFRKILNFGKNNENIEFFLITDYKRNKVYYNEDLNILIANLLNNGIINKNQLYSNNDINQEIPNVENDKPNPLPTIEQFNESITYYAKVNKITYETINIDNIKEILNNKKEDVKRRERNYNNLVHIYDQLKNTLDGDLKLLCSNNLKNALMILNNEKNELNKLSVLYLKITQEHVQNLMSDVIKKTIHGMEVINE